jgi:hypothetical protein
MHRIARLGRGVVYLAVAVAATAAIPAFAAGADSTKDVIVANTAANPAQVAVQGTAKVAIQGTPAVTIAGSPTVTVAGTIATAAPTLTPVQKTQFGTFASGSRFSSTINLYTVPAGKQLVIQTVSVGANLFAGDQRLMHVLFNAQSGDVIPFVINVQPVDEGLFASTGAEIFRGTQTVTAYAGPGTTVTAVGTRTGTDINTTDSVSAGVAGYLVDAS